MKIEFEKEYLRELYDIRHSVEVEAKLKRFKFVTLHKYLKR